MNDVLIRSLVFVALIGSFALWEAYVPARARVYTRLRRWPTNLAMGAANAAILRLVVPLLAVIAAEGAADTGIGLLNQIALPVWMEIAIAVVALDAVIFGQHRLFHRMPWLWRIHSVHHADRDVDVTTALRFHPLEIVLSAGIKLLAVLALGAPPLAVLLFEIILNGMAMFNHANLALPGRLDPLLRRVLVTPAMHRLHHATVPGPRLPNFGFNLSLWDRLLGTYADPADRPADFVLGLADYQDDRPTRLRFALGLPFARRPKTALDSGRDSSAGAKTV